MSQKRKSSGPPQPQRLSEHGLLLMDKISVIPTTIVYPSVSIEANPEHDPDIPSMDFECEIGNSCRLDDDGKSIHLNISYTSGTSEENNLSYTIDIKFYANISMSCKFQEIPSKNQNEIFEDIASLAFGSIRETIASITARGPWGVYLVPFLNHKELGDDLLNSIKEDIKSKKKTKKKT